MSPARRARRVAILLATAMTATSCYLLRPPDSDERPRWRVAATELAHDCVLARGFVRKTGKTGFGMTLELRSRGDCAVAIARAEVVLADGHRAPAGIRALAPLRGRSLIYTWLAFPFDNNAAWNRGVVDGQVELDLVVNGRRAPTWRLAAHQEMP